MAKRKKIKKLRKMPHSRQAKRFTLVAVLAVIDLVIIALLIKGKSLLLGLGLGDASQRFTFDMSNPMTLLFLGLLFALLIFLFAMIIKTAFFTKKKTITVIHHSMNPTHVNHISTHVIPMPKHMQNHYLKYVAPSVNNVSEEEEVIKHEDLIKPIEQPITPITPINTPKVEEEVTPKNTDRFQRLSMLDEKYKEKEKVQSTENLTLEYLCRRFRSFASRIEGNPLYYSIHDIRRFIASLGVSKILVLQGMSGTGKTSLPVAWGKFTKTQTTVVPVQPMWKERSDLIGYYNEFTGKFNESMILEKLYEANKSNRIYLIVLDELNIARVEYYFAEFLSLLELPTVEERILEVTSSISKDDPVELHNGKLTLPDNVWFIGTANNDDSTFAISDKVYDRSMVLNLDYRCDAFIGEDDHDPITISDETFKELLRKAKKEYSLTRRSRKRIKEFDAFIQETFSITFGNRIRRQMEAYIPIYIACGGSELEALDDIFAKKVLRKLESQNPVYVKTRSEDLISKLNEIFGTDQMPVCEAYIRKIANNG